MGAIRRRQVREHQNTNPQQVPPLHPLPESKHALRWLQVDLQAQVRVHISRQPQAHLLQHLEGKFRIPQKNICLYL